MLCACNDLPTRLQVTGRRVTGPKGMESYSLVTQTEKMPAIFVNLKVNTFLCTIHVMPAIRLWADLRHVFKCV